MEVAVQHQVLYRSETSEHGKEEEVEFPRVVVANMYQKEGFLDVDTLPLGEKDEQVK